MWGAHGKAVTPWLYAPAADAYATAVHYLMAGGGTMDQVLAILSAGAVAEGVTELRNHRHKRRPAVRKGARAAVAAATAWGLIDAAATTAGWHGLVQWSALAAAVVWPGMHAIRSRDTPAGSRRRALPAPPDPRLRAFISRFTEGPHAPLAGAVVRNFSQISRGFSLEVFFPAHTNHTIADVQRLAPLIAKLFDVSADSVSVGYVPEHRSEARALVTVEDKPASAKPGGNRWDGTSTYDPAEGTVELGWFLDDKPARYRLHMPRSGTAAGFAAGSMGSGKTGAIHVLAAEAGLACLCSRCAAQRACVQCDMQRMAAVWLADPQMQPLGAWCGRADLLAWGPEGCVEMLQLADTVARARGEDLGTRTWTDHLGRVNNSKGWFDPEPGFPLIFLIIDEFPILANHDDPVLRKEVLTLMVRAVTQWRKLGIHVLFASQMLDISQTGARELRDMAKFFNAIALRCDEISSQMGGIKGDPRKLPPNEPGSGYISGPDNRPADKFRVKFIPEYVRPGEDGPDVRGISEAISQMPLVYDQAVLRAMKAFGLSHQQVITEWHGRAGDVGRTAAAAAPPAPGQPSSRGPGLDGLPTKDEAELVKAALGAPGNGTDIYQLMEATGLSLLAVGRSLDLLTANGDAVRTGGDHYAAA